jgi:ankyrin repeat protein
LVLFFGFFDRYKYYWLGVAGFTATEPFQVMSERPNVSQIQTYIDRGFDVNARDTSNHPLIYHAMNNDLPDVVKMLIERGADTSDSANLIEVEENKFKAIYQRKQDKDDRLNKIYDPQNKPGLQQINEETFKKDIKELNDNSVNGIAYYAVQRNRITILEMLLKRGFNPNRTYPDNNKLSLLHLASVHQDGAIVKLLLDRGVDPNIKDSLGCTPLHTAIVRDLMPYSYKLSSYVSFDRANSSISKQAIIYLMQAGAIPDIYCDLNGNWDRFYNRREENIDSVAKLISFKMRIYSNIDKYSSPYQLLPFFDPTGIDLNSYRRSN